MKIGYLKKDQEERRTAKRIYWGVAWRIVDDKGEDLFQPWSRTRKEALDVAGRLNIAVITKAKE
jgi:hypothetical protein